MYKVYIKLDDNKCITNVESTAFYTEEELTEQGYIYLDEGEDGETYGHAQPNYLLNKYGKSTYEELGNPNFKYDNGRVLILSETEKEELFKTSPPQPSEQEKLNADIMRELAMLKMKVGIK